MSDSNNKMNSEIDAGKFFLTIFYVIFGIGAIWFSIWFFKDVYKIEEKNYIKSSKYVYKIFQDEVIDFYKSKGYVFDEKNENDDEFCQLMIKKYAKNKNGTCNNTNPLMPIQNFEFKNKKITVYGLEKPVFDVYGTFVKDILIDVNTDNKGNNTVGSDRVILRIYSSGRVGGVVTPVNCSRQDEIEYGFKTSTYCIGSPEVNYMILNIPLGFDIEQIGAEDGKTKTVGKNLGYLRADCTALDGFITGADEYCSEKMLYTLKSCDEDYSCNITLTKY